MRKRDYFYFIVLLLIFFYNAKVLKQHNEFYKDVAFRKNNINELLVSFTQESFYNGCQNMAIKVCQDIDPSSKCLTLLSDCQKDSVAYEFKTRKEIEDQLKAADPSN